MAPTLGNCAQGRICSGTSRKWRNVLMRAVMGGSCANDEGMQEPATGRARGGLVGRDLVRLRRRAVP